MAAAAVDTDADVVDGAGDCCWRNTTVPTRANGFFLDPADAEEGDGRIGVGVMADAEDPDGDGDTNGAGDNDVVTTGPSYSAHTVGEADDDGLDG